MKTTVLKTYSKLYSTFSNRPYVIKQLDKVYHRIENLSTFDKPSVLETYADLYDIFEDSPEMVDSLYSIYEELRKI